VTGTFTWRVHERFRHSETTHQAIAHNVDNMFRSYVAPEHVAGLARSLRTTPDTFDVVLTPVDASVRGEVIRVDVIGGRCAADVIPERPRLLRVSTQCREDARIRIGQLYSPLWRVGSLPPASSPPVLGSSPDGLIEVALSAGQQDFSLVFDGRWPERGGVIVTIASLATVVGGSVYVAYRKRVRKSNAHEEQTRP
jgi:hypothetical protein